MHICHLSLDYPTGTGGSGVGTQVHTLAHALVADGHEVTVIALAETGLPDREDDHGVRIRRVRPGSLHWYVSKLPWLGSRLARPLRELEYGWVSYQDTRKLQREKSIDVIEGTETGMFFVALLLRRIPLVIRLHGEEFTFARNTPGRHVGASVWMSRVLQRIAIARARILVSPSIAHAREIRQELGGRTPRMEVIPNNIPLLPDTVHPPPSRARTGLMVLYVGRLEHRKGIAVLLEAAARINEMVPGTRLVLAGKRHSSLPQAELDRMLLNTGLSELIEMPGHIPREQLPDWYRRAEVCVCPSFYETFGLSALEGMAAGVPVVVTNAGAFPEVVSDGVCGILVKPGDSEALATAVITMLRDPDLRARMGQAGRNRAKRSFEVQRQLQDNVRLYQRAVVSEWEASGLAARTGEHVFFSPHLDDAAISCGGLIELLLRRGARVKIITIFTQLPAVETLSAFARHLHAKWKLADDQLVRRREEDSESMAALGVDLTEYWDFPDAPYRLGPAGEPLYASYQQLRGKRADADAELALAIQHRIETLVAERAPDAVFYFPAGIGSHVDHRILNLTGRQLCDSGAEIRFYEDWPYVEKFEAETSPDWIRHAIQVPLEQKIKATVCHRSQFREPPGVLSRRFKDLEYYWVPKPGSGFGGIERAEMPYFPLKPVVGWRDIRKLAAAYRFHDLDEILPEGRGICIDLGAGPGRHRGLVESRGYRWFGMERSRIRGNRNMVRGDIVNAPFAAGCAAGVVAWQVAEYLEEPERLFVEAARLLSPGGVFCGSVSFLEPVHGQTYYNLSPLILEKLLHRHGFADISIKPGINGLTLQIWTWLGRVTGRRSARLAPLLSAAITAPLVVLRFSASWVWAQFGLGTGFGMRRTFDKEPLEFAGHILFCARKTGNCT